MEALQSILLKRNHQEQQHLKEKIAQKPKRKKKSESLEAIFRLPKSVLDKFRTPEQNHPLKRERSGNQRLDMTIQLGNIGQEYHHNLRKTILNQTKEILNSAKPHRSAHQQNNFMLKDEMGRNRSSFTDKYSYNAYSTQYETNIKTLNILQKAIIKEDDLFQTQENLFELQANRLPMIRKRESKRKQLLKTFQQKLAAQSPPRREIIREERPVKKNVEHIDDSSKKKIEKPDIRGWDTPQLLQI